MFCDYNHNARDEMFMFMMRDTSLYLLGFEYNSDTTDQNWFREIFIDNVYKKGVANDFRISSGPVVDMNGDGFDDFVFCIRGGYCAKPRGLYFYDIHNDTLKKSPQSAISYYEPLYWTTATDSMHKFLFSCMTGATSNYSETDYEYHDRCSWAFLMNSRMEFTFPPVPSKMGYFNSIYSVPFSNDTISGLVSLFTTPVGSEKPMDLTVFDTKGDALERKEIPCGEMILLNVERECKDYFLLYDLDKQELSKWSVDLKKRKSWNLNPKDFIFEGQRHFFQLNIDAQPENELLFADGFGKLTITDQNFGNRSSFEIDIKEPLSNIQVFKTKESDVPIIVITKDHLNIFYTYTRNNLFYLRYPVWLAIYLAFFTFFFFSMRYQRSVVQRRYDLQQKLCQSQMLAIKNQVDPHFMLNSINNISSMFMAGNSDAAQSYLTKLTRIMYRGLMTSEKLMNTLGEEIEFVTDYCDIQQHRFKHLFEYEVTVQDEAFLGLYVPGHVIYTFVENAIKHGLRPLKSDGKLLIKVEENTTQQLQITIEDNGIGRKEAKKRGYHSTGKGVGIARKTIDLFREVNDIYITLQYIDKSDKDENCTGTMVVLEMEKVIKNTNS